MHVCTVWYTAVCSSAVFVVFRMNSGPCLKDRNELLKNPMLVNNSSAFLRSSMVWGGTSDAFGMAVVKQYHYMYTCCIIITPHACQVQSRGTCRLPLPPFSRCQQKIPIYQARPHSVPTYAVKNLKIVLRVRLRSRHLPLISLRKLVLEVLRPPWETRVRRLKQRLISHFTP